MTVDTTNSYWSEFTFRCSQFYHALTWIIIFRGARASNKDGGGLGVLGRDMEVGAITDEEL